MIDWHTHVLPAMDDGSRDVTESLALLRTLREQGIDRVVATPHFYADDESVGAFLSRREAAYRSLQAADPSSDLPKLLLGAEVRYYAGISRLAELEQLKIQSTDLLLLEMPTERWSTSMLNELQYLGNMPGVQLVIAHIDRYQRLQPRGTVEALCQSGIIMQVNASALNDFWGRRLILRQLRNRQILFIGSDCHNMTDRRPQIGMAYRRVASALGDAFVEEMTAFGTACLERSYAH